MSYLYKRSNWLWYWLIRLRLVHKVWSPLVEWTRRRHLKFRERLGEAALDAWRELTESTPELAKPRAPSRSSSVVSAGV